MFAFSNFNKIQDPPVPINAERPSQSSSLLRYLSSDTNIPKSLSVLSTLLVLLNVPLSTTLQYCKLPIVTVLFVYFAEYVVVLSAVLESNKPFHGICETTLQASTL